MANVVCPRCGTEVATTNGWMAAALSTTIAAPAVPDMATQVRCPNCRTLFAASDVRHTRSSRRGLRHLPWVLSVLALLAWWLS